MTLFKPRVGKVIFAQTTGGFAVIIPIYIYIHTHTHTHIGETDSWAYGYTTDTNMYMLVYEGSK